MIKLNDGKFSWASAKFRPEKLKNSEQVLAISDLGTLQAAQEFLIL
jgi:hypothetical protein